MKRVKITVDDDGSVMTMTCDKAEYYGSDDHGDCSDCEYYGHCNQL